MEQFAQQLKQQEQHAKELGEEGRQQPEQQEVGDTNESADNPITNEMAVDMMISEILPEMQQLASRLLVKNQNLYGKYDRQMAEASVRMNVSAPLTLVLVLATWQSSLPFRLQIALTLVSSVFGFMLLRQGFLRAISARDVIVQALVIGEVESRHMPSETMAASSTEKREPTGKEESPKARLVRALGRAAECPRLLRFRRGQTIQKTR